jgi:hypothetical protein
MNRTGRYKFKGISWNKNARKWKVKIVVASKNIYLGYFTCPIEAAQAYNAAALIHHGEFARLNEIPA